MKQKGRGRVQLVTHRGTYDYHKIWNRVNTADPRRMKPRRWKEPQNSSSTPSRVSPETRFARFGSACFRNAAAAARISRQQRRRRRKQRGQYAQHWTRRARRDLSRLCLRSRNVTPREVRIFPILDDETLIPRDETTPSRRTRRCTPD